MVNAATIATVSTARAALETDETPASNFTLDASAWTEIFDQNYAPIYRYACARLASPDEAEEIASQVFLEALRGIHKYQPTEKPILAWLYGIARNLVANHVRRRQRAKNAHESLAQRLSLRGADLIVDRMDLANALRRLTNEQRDVITLRYLSGLSTAEIAATLQRTPGAIYSLQVRALTSLRKVLAS